MISSDRRAASSNVLRSISKKLAYTVQSASSSAADRPATFAYANLRRAAGTALHCFPIPIPAEPGLPEGLWRGANGGRIEPPSAPLRRLRERRQPGPVHLLRHLAGHVH